MEITWPSSATNNSSCSRSSGVMCALTCAVRFGLAMSKKEDARRSEDRRANQQGTIWRSLAGGGSKLEIQPQLGGCYEIRDLSCCPGRLCVREGREPFAAEKGRLRGMRGELSERRFVVPWGWSRPSDADQRLHARQRILSSCGLRVEDVRFGAKPAVRDSLDLKLPKRRRIFSPAGDAALFDAERVRQSLLGFVALNSFCRSHI
jgi:hypothetical protein